MTAVAPTSAALGAFLRGIERRAALLAELQCGDAGDGEAALGAAMRAFGAVASRAPLSHWPVRFWSLLLSAPQLRQGLLRDVAPGPWRSLATLGNGPRALLLLRLVAGLGQDDAAVVLGVPSATCDHALRDALERLAGGQPASAAWTAWEARAQQALKGLPAARLARLARLRETSLAMPSGVALPVTRPRVATDARWPVARWRRPAQAALALCAVVLAASFIRPAWFVRGPDRDPRIRTEPLPPAEPPAERFDADLRAWSHRDFDLLADSPGLRAARGLPLLAWYAAQRATQAAGPPPDAGTAPPTAATMLPAGEDGATPPPPDAVTPSLARLSAPAGGGALPVEAEAAIARLPAPLQPEARVHASRWFAWTPEERATCRQREAAWDAQAPSLRGEQREAYAAWRALDADALRQVEAAARAYEALPPEQREGLRARFLAQDAALQRGWLLGPALGGDYPRLQPLIAQLPEALHAPLLAVLRSLPSAERDGLSVLAQRTPPQARADLLRELLSTSEANRPAWLQARLAR